MLLTESLSSSRVGPLYPGDTENKQEVGQLQIGDEGARHHGYTGKRGYHPLLAVAAGTGDVLMARLREGRANTARGAAHFLRETVGRVRYAGVRGQLTMRTDSGFYTHSRGIRLPPDGCPLLHHHPPAPEPSESHRSHARRCLDADSLVS